jgi:hypothetical protein
MRGWLYGLALAAGLGHTFWPTLASGFERTQTDPGDTLLNHYILEHTWLWLTRSDYVGTLWSPPFFHPTPDALAYSENLLGTAPVYWLLRAACPAPLAYQLWMMLVSALTFAAMVVLLRGGGVRPSLSALGGLLLAFGLPRINQLNHQQLLPQMAAPLAVLALWCFLQRPRTPTLLALTLAVDWQVYASIHLGWFLVVALPLFLAGVMLADVPAWGRLAEYARRNWPAAGGVLLAGAVVLVPLFEPYVRANEGFRRNYEECLLPHRRSWLTPPEDCLWAKPLAGFRRGQEHEQFLFGGFAVYGLFALAGLTSLMALGGRSRWPRADRALLVGASAAAAGLFLLSLRWHGGGSAWEWVYRFVPGAPAIRTVTRVATAVYLFGLLAGLFALDRWAKGRWGAAVCALVAAIAIAEQFRWGPASFRHGEFFAEVEERSRELAGERFGYVPLDSRHQFWHSQLIGMWAGLRANVPVVNGYSGRTPPGYPDWRRTMTADELEERVTTKAQRSHKDPQRREE